MYRTFGPDKDGTSYTVFGSHIIAHKGPLSILRTESASDWIRVTFGAPTLDGRYSLTLDRELWDQWKNLQPK